MAKPIGPTPELEGEDAIEFLKRMYEPPTEEDKNFGKKFFLKGEFLSNFSSLDKDKMFFRGMFYYFI